MEGVDGVKVKVQSQSPIEGASLATSPCEETNVVPVTGT